MNKIKAILKKIDERVDYFTSGFGDEEYFNLRDRLDEELNAVHDKGEINPRDHIHRNHLCRGSKCKECVNTALNDQ